MNKQIETIPTATMTALVNWDWPGNVRELENLMERSVILSDGRVLNVPVAEITGGRLIADSNQTLESMERRVHHSRIAGIQWSDRRSSGRRSTARDETYYSTVTNSENWESLAKSIEARSSERLRFVTGETQALSF